MRSAGQQIAQAVLSSIDNKDSGITNPINWPSSAQFGVEYEVHDKQFPQVKHEPSVVYFDDNAALLHWLHEKREWVKSTDHDFSMKYSVYSWEWGPLYDYTKTM